jgi:hypothetical protein
VDNQAVSPDDKQEFKITAEEFGQALMAAANLHPEKSSPPPKPRERS